MIIKVWLLLEKPLKRWHWRSWSECKSPGWVRCVWRVNHSPGLMDVSPLYGWWWRALMVLNAFQSNLKCSMWLCLPLITPVAQTHRRCFPISHTHTHAIHTHRRISPPAWATVSDGIISELCCGPCEGGITYLFAELSSCLYHLSPRAMRRLQEFYSREMGWERKCGTLDGVNVRNEEKKEEAPPRSWL